MLRPLRDRRLFLAIAVSLFAFAGAAKPYVRMVRSKPVSEGGVDFQAATQNEWIVYNRPVGHDKVDIRLEITNLGDQPLLFPTFDTFRLSLQTADGQDVPMNGGRDGVLRGAVPVLVSPHETYSLCRGAHLEWIDKGPGRRLVYQDGTGSMFAYGPLEAGKYTLRFSYHNAKEMTFDGYSAWTGEVRTALVEFTLAE